MKFEAYEISEKERTQLIGYLRSPGSISSTKSHAGLLIFCYSSEPVPENIELVRRFLAKHVEDYTRSAAVTGLYRIWKLGRATDIDDLLGLVALWPEDSRYSTSISAIGCAFLLMHLLHDRRLSLALGRLLENLHEELRRDNDLAVGLFIHACWSVYDNWAQSNVQRRIHFDTIEGALPIYWDRQKYLLESIN
jgi:hypothetical protein